MDDTKKISALFFLSLLLTTACRPTPMAAIARAWPVMGTIFSVKVWGETSEASIDAARREVFVVDEKMSTYRRESEISNVNRNAGNHQFNPVSQETIDVIRRALEIGEESGGRFDIAIGPLVSTWKFFTPWQGEEVELPDPKLISAARMRSQLKDVEVDEKHSRVRLKRKGMMIDLGGIAKGYALDRAALLFENHPQTSALLDLGGQVRFVGSDPEGGDWQVAIRHPRDETKTLAVISVPGGSISTSGDSDRYFVHKGVRYAHIIDPTTGYPARGILSVTVWAPKGIDADGWSTALFVAGLEAGEKLLLKHPEFGAVWIRDPGNPSIGPEDIVVAGALVGKVH